MANENLPQALEPRSWQQYVYQKHAVKYLQHFVRSGNHPNAILIEGPSGVGKSTLAKLYVQATHCEKRKAGQVEACGECNSCCRNLQTAPVTSDVLWLQKGGDTTIESQVKQALEIRQQPTYRAEEPHRDIRFIVADEIQSYGSSLLEQLLQVEWGCVTPTVFIFITMQADRIDPTLYQALKDRCFPINLLPIPKDEIRSYLLRCWPQMNTEAADIVASVSEGSIRHALSYMRLLEIEAADPLTGRGITSVHAHTVLNLATAEVRKKLWAALQNTNVSIKELKSIYESITAYVLERRLARQLADDIDQQCLEQTQLSEEQLWARHLLLLSYSDPVLTLWDVIVSLKNRFLVSSNGTFNDDLRGRVI